MNEIKKYLWLSQVLLVGLLIVCCFIIPSVVVRNGGVSNFGNHTSTVVPYTLSFSLSIIFLVLAGYKTQKLNPNLSRIAWMLFVLGFLTLLVLLSTFPRHISFAYSDLHDDLGIALFAYEFFVSVWLVLQKKSVKTYTFIFIQALGSIVGLLSILKVVHFLFIGQLVGTVGFSLLLVTTLPDVIEDKLGVLIRKK